MAKKAKAQQLDHFAQFADQQRPLNKDEIKKIKTWLAIRKEAGRHIDPKTAEVTWEFAQTLDPYGLGLDIPEECQQVGREYFARAPGSDVWVLFGDLPKRTCDALMKMHGHRLCSFVVQDGRLKWNI